MHNKSHFLFEITTLFMLISAFSSFAGSVLNSIVVDNKMYFLIPTGKISIYDIEKEVWEKSLPLSRPKPTKFHVDENYIFINYDNDTSISKKHVVYRYDHTLNNEQLVRDTLPHDCSGIFSDGQYLFLFIGKLIESIKIENNSLISSKNMREYYQGLSQSKKTRTFYARTSGFTPEDIVMITYNEQGELLYIRDSPYHGDFPNASQTWTFPDGASVVDDKGMVYSGDSLVYKSSLGINTSPIDVVFWDTLVLTANYGGLITAYDTTQLLEVGRISLGNQLCGLYAKEDNLLVFSRDSSSEFGLRMTPVTYSELKPAKPVSVDGLYKCSKTPSNEMFIIDSILHVFGPEDAQLFRWNIHTQQWIRSICFLDNPTQIEYLPEIDALCMLYSTGRITIIEHLKDVQVERPLYTIPRPASITSAGKYLLVGNNMVIAPDQTVRNPAANLPAVPDQFLSPNWSEDLKSLFFMNKTYTICRISMDNDGTFTKIFTAPEKEPLGLGSTILKPDGALVLIGGASGNIYNGTTLEYYNHIRINFVSYGTWLGDELYTIDLGSLIQWSPPTYQISNSAAISEQSMFIGATDEELLLVAEQNRNGLPFITLFDRNLKKVALGETFKTTNKQISRIKPQPPSFRYFDLSGRVISRNIIPNGVLIGNNSATGRNPELKLKKK